MFKRINEAKQFIITVIFFYFIILFFLSKWYHFKSTKSVHLLEHEWKISLNSNRAGGKAVKGMQNLKTCMQECSSTIDCQSFDYLTDHSSFHNCWLHLSNNSYSVRYNLAPGILHYEKVSNLRKKRNCEWREKKDTWGLGGMMMKGVSTRKACREACEMVWNCGGFNWDENEFDEFERCSLTSIVATIQPFSGSSHLTRKCDCGWKDYKDTSSTSGYLQKTIKTLKACMHACLEVPPCTSLDWNSIQGTCLFSTSKEATRQYGIDHYEYECGSV